MEISITPSNLLYTMKDRIERLELLINEVETQTYSAEDEFEIGCYEDPEELENLRSLFENGIKVKSFSEWDTLTYSYMYPNQEKSPILDYIKSHLHEVHSYSSIPGKTGDKSRFFKVNTPAGLLRVHGYTTNHTPEYTLMWEESCESMEEFLIDNIYIY